MKLKLKIKIIWVCLSVLVVRPVYAQIPVYQDENKPIEERVKDALSRMTLEEKVALCHAMIHSAVHLQTTADRSSFDRLYPDCRHHQ